MPLVRVNKTTRLSLSAVAHKYKGTEKKSNLGTWHALNLMLYTCPKGYLRVLFEMWHACNAMELIFSFFSTTAAAVVADLSFYVFNRKKA